MLGLAMWMPTSGPIMLQTMCSDSTLALAAAVAIAGESLTSDVPTKMLELYHTDWVEMAETGYCSDRLYAAFLMLRAQTGIDTYTRHCRF